MNDRLPNEDIMYAALLARDESHDGRWYVGVKTTGVFCRSVCPARKPKRDNCVFFASTTACLTAGFRACRRCHPLGAAADEDHVIQDLLARLAADPERRWCEADITALGYDNASVRRRFKRQFGITFLALARQQRIGQAFTSLAAARPVIDAQLTAGFDSASGFRQAFATLLGTTPGRLKRRSKLVADWLTTPLGAMLAVGDDRRLSLLEFIDRRALPTELQRLQQRTGVEIGVGRPAALDQASIELTNFFAGESATFATPLAMHGSDFTQQVWRYLESIPAGETRSYADVASALGRPTAVRAVARANGANQIAIMIPCHRVIGADGKLTGYGGGLWRKQQLLDLENNYRQSSASGTSV
ncbi:MAG: trifunctional transcriptional activator/DNA repair protein Ada/methylated-DNA--[protein]-cysteine S-methyltransferase [Pseudomonadota bacterium]